MSNCGLVEFAITDGTVVIDLLASNKHGAGFGVQNYVPGRPQLKDGGIWQDSNTESGRQLVFGVDTNIVDVVTLVCAGSSQSQVIQAFEELDLLLQKMRAYWTTNWQQTPVYLRARAKGEVATRYALIHYAKYDEYFNPYGELFAGNGFKVCTEEFAFGIEHGLWLDLPPGQSESIAITHEKNSGDPIDADADEEGLFISNTHLATDAYGANGGLIAILRDDGGTFSGNLLEGSPPYNLINAAEATNDAVYFGAVNHFWGLIFDTTSLSAGSTRVWEYWNGSSWATLGPTYTSTNNPVLETLGITHVYWTSGSMLTWAKTTVDTGPYLYWIRLRTTSGGGNGPLTQGNRHVYASSVGYVEVDLSAMIRGTQNAALKMDIDWWHTNNTVARTGPFVYVGMRSVERGEQFAAQLHVWGGNPIGIEFLSNSVLASIVQPGIGPAGVEISPSASLATIAYIRFSAAHGIHKHYYGDFRLFARVNTDDDTGESRARYRVGRPSGISPLGIVVTTGETVNVPAVDENYVLVDLGYISLPGGNSLQSAPVGDFTIGLDFSVATGKTITLWDVFLLPVDEWVGEIDGQATPNTELFPIRLNGIDDPKGTRAYVDGAEELNATTSGAPIVAAGARQRFWYLFNISGLNAQPWFLANIRLAMVQRNLSLRSYD